MGESKKLILSIFMGIQICLKVNALFIEVRFVPSSHGLWWEEVHFQLQSKCFLLDSGLKDVDVFAITCSDIVSMLIVLRMMS